MMLLLLLNCFMPTLNAMDYTKADQMLIARMPPIMQDIFHHPRDAKSALEVLLRCIQTPARLEDLRWQSSLDELNNKKWNIEFNQNKNKCPLSTWEETIPKREAATAISHQVYIILKRQRKYPLSPTTMISLASDVCNAILYDQKPTTPPFDKQKEIQGLKRIVAQLSSDSFSKHFCNRLEEGFSHNSERSMRLVRKCQNIAASIYTLQKCDTDEKNCIVLDAVNEFPQFTENVEMIIFCSAKRLFTNELKYKNKQIAAQAEAIVQSFKNRLAKQKKT